MIRLTLLLLMLGWHLSNSVKASYNKDWSVRAYIGASSIADQTVTAMNIDNFTGTADVSLDSGFNAGLGFTYHFNPDFSAEIAWEYRSNDSTTSFNTTAQYDDGNYASSIFFLNGFYNLDLESNLMPYLGGGLSWVQEIDIDIEQEQTEESFSGSGDIGFQIFAGLNYALSNQWQVQFELRYGSITDINLDDENNSTQGQISGIDYQPFTAQLGLVYRF